jgi:hypothetical protein
MVAQSIVALACHPDGVDAGVHAVDVAVSVQAARLQLVYRLRAEMPGIRIPPRVRSCRQDELWRRTCFEAFLSLHGSVYCEFNFSPSTQWAAYRFDDYRRGMADLPLRSPPRITVRQNTEQCVLEAALDLHGLLSVTDKPGTCQRMALAAVIEDDTGGLHHWAVAHPPGKPDFHHIDGFVVALGDNGFKLKK